MHPTFDEFKINNLNSVSDPMKQLLTLLMEDPGAVFELCPLFGNTMRKIATYLSNFNANYNMHRLNNISVNEVTTIITNQNYTNKKLPYIISGILISYGNPTTVDDVLVNALQLDPTNIDEDDIMNELGTHFSIL